MLALALVISRKSLGLPAIHLIYSDLFPWRHPATIFGSVAALRFFRCAVGRTSAQSDPEVRSNASLGAHGLCVVPAEGLHPLLGSFSRTFEDLRAILGYLLDPCWGDNLTVRLRDRDQPAVSASVLEYLDWCLATCSSTSGSYSKMAPLICKMAHCTLKASPTSRRPLLLNNASTASISAHPR